MSSSHQLNNLLPTSEKEVKKQDTEKVSDLYRPRIAELYEKLRPSIDEVLKNLNFSPRHVTKSEITDAFSLRYNIAPSALSCSKDDGENSPGTRVIFRITAPSGNLRVEIPANRLKFYTDAGLTLVETTAKNLSWRKISIESEQIEPLRQALKADMSDYLLTYPCDFGCCDLCEKCSDTGRCLMKDQDMSARCFYKRNLASGRIFYGSRSKRGDDSQ